MTLDDLLQPGLRLVICGTAVATASAGRGHYYAGPGNEFWMTLHRSGLTPVQFAPEDDALLLKCGIGLTDLAKDVAQSHDAGLAKHYDVPAFFAKIDVNKPVWLGLHGKEAGKVVARSLGHPEPRLGLQPWPVGSSKVFVLPSTSGANRDPSRWGGRASRTEWFEDLAVLLDAEHV